MFVRPVFLSFKVLIHYPLKMSISGGTVVPVRGFNLSVWDIPPVMQLLFEGTYVRNCWSCSKYTIFDAFASSTLSYSWSRKNRKYDAAYAPVFPGSTLSTVPSIKTRTVLDLLLEASDKRYCEMNSVTSVSESTTTINLMTPPTSLNRPSHSITAELITFQPDTYSPNFTFGSIG